MSPLDNLKLTDNRRVLSFAKKKIVDRAVALFATKGFTETSIRELAATVGIQGSVIYHHFESKNAILEYIIEDYAKQNFYDIDEKKMYSLLINNPTADGILSCMNLMFPKGREAYYVKVLCVILQEQHRNPSVRNFMTEMILKAEQKIKIVFSILKEMNVIRQDADQDLWMKIVSSLLYTYANRSMLGIGDRSPEYDGMGMVDLLRATYDEMLKSCAVTKDGDGL